nr:hypothetical protein [Streptomyces sp. PVA_94-07]
MVSVEDPLAEDDWEGWRELSARVGDRCRSPVTTCSARTRRWCARASVPAGARALRPPASPSCPRRRARAASRRSRGAASRSSGGPGGRPGRPWSSAGLRR